MRIRGLRFTHKGGPHSGHHGHSGLAGQPGGSLGGDYTQVYVPAGFTEQEAELAATFIWEHELGDKPTEKTRELLDSLVLGEKFDTLGDWADDTLNKVRSKQIVEAGKKGGFLHDGDYDTLMAMNIGRTRRFVSVVPNKDMGLDRVAVEKEWGISRHAIMPMMVMGTAQYEIRKGWNIRINELNPSKRHTFWHELGHTVSGSVIRKFIGPVKSGETGGAYIDRFANHMEKIGQ